jgi:hypothetical protein
VNFGRVTLLNHFILVLNQEDIVNKTMMIKKIQEKRWFTTEIDGQKYDCVIWCESNCRYNSLTGPITPATAFYYYLTIQKINVYNKRFLFYKWIKEIIAWEYKYLISCENLFSTITSNRHYEYINGITYYDIDDVKKWVRDAIDKKNIEINKEKEESEKEEKIEHQVRI